MKKISRYPLSPMQQGMVLETMLAPCSGVNLSQLVCRIKREIDPTALRRAGQRIVDRHDILRTRFVLENLDTPAQEVCESMDLPFAVQNCEGISPHDFQRFFESFIAEDQRRGFDLANGPLVRIQLFRIARTDWLFVWSNHHALLDGRSRIAILKELFHSYESYCRNEELELPPTQPFRDYIEWLNAQTFVEAGEYWGQFSHLAPGLLPAAEAGKDAPVTPERYPTLNLQISDDLEGRLRAAAERQSVSLSTLVQGSWAILLSAYTGERDVIFGFTRAGRQKGPEGIQTLVGLCINTLPVGLRLDAGSSLTGSLRELRRISAAGRSVEHVPLPAMQKASGKLTASELFESLVVLERSDMTSELMAESQGAEFSRYGFSLHTLTLYGYLNPRLKLDITFDRHRFDEHLREQLAGHFQHALEWVASAEPEAKVGDAQLLSRAEWQQLTQDWSGTRVPAAAGGCLHELFEAQAARLPDVPALQFEEMQFSYRELNERANQLAHCLRRQGVGPETRVGVCMQRSPEAIIALLGILKAGGAYVPLDPAYPRERLRRLAEAAGIGTWVTQRQWLNRLPSAPDAITCMDRDWASIARERRANPQRLALPQNLAYVIYTSGSTGFPKGTMIPHCAAGSFVETARRLYQLESTDRCLQFASLSFDTSVEEIFPCLISGATLVLRTADMLQDVVRFFNRCLEWGITVLDLPTAYWHEMLGLWRTHDEIEFPTQIRLVIIGGERAQDASLRIWKQKATDGIILQNTYGPTETTVVATAANLAREERPSDTREVEIGSPIAGARIYVLNRQGQPAIPGVRGEICIGGSGVARGYLSRPDLTAERFLPDPFEGSGTRLYRTGDFGRFRSNGNLEFLGRSDQQIKIRGYRVEIGEIEAALRKHPVVKQALIVLRDDYKQEPQLVAYYVQQEPQPTTPDALRTYLFEHLPEYMVPTMLVRVEFIPLTPHGKVDIKALPVPRYLEPEDYVAPRTGLEGLIAEIWAYLLGIPRVSIRDNFFTLGGHSLLAMRALSRIREITQAEIPIQYFFDHPTIAALAARLDATQGAVGNQPPLVKRRAGRIPLSYAQERLWFLQEFEGGSVYNLPLAFRFYGSLDQQLLQQALQTLVQRHESLRTHFAESSAGVEQVVSKTMDWKLSYVDLSKEKEEEQREAEIGRLVRREAEEPFDLRRGPLLRGMLIRSGVQEHVLTLTMHHIVSDGWSLSVLAREMGAVYRGLKQGQPVTLPELPIQYGDYATWQREWLQGQQLERRLQYWKQRLERAPQVLELPLRGKRPEVQGHLGAQHRFVIGRELLQGLEELGRREGATLFMVLLTGFGVVLNRYSGQREMLIGMPTAGRTHRETEGLIGFFVNTLVVRIEVEGGEPVRELLRRVRENALGAYEHQDVPFEKLVEELQPERDVRRSPVVQVMMLLQNTPKPEWGLEGLQVVVREVEIGTAKMDLTLTLEERTAEEGGGLAGKLQYNVELFAAEMVERMGEHFVAGLREMIVDAGRRVGELRLLGEREWEQAVREWNRTAEDYGERRCVHQMFEAQVERRPDAVAVVGGEESWSYRELNQRANQVAHYLLRQGVGPEMIVGVCLERSLEMVAVVMGVWKAGAAYVALDPAYPFERIALMMEIAKAAKVIVRSAREPGIALDRKLLIGAEEVWKESTEEEERNPGLPVLQGCLAFLVFTSGSTGKPKGVASTGRNLVNRMMSVWQLYPFREGEVCCQKTSVSFVDWIPELLSPLLQGVPLVIISDAVVKSTHAFVEELKRHRITRIVLVPSLLRTLLDLVPNLGEQLPDLWHWTVSGEAIPPALTKAFRKALRDAVLLNLYGSAEVTADSTGAEIQSSSETVVLGKPLANVEVYVLNQQMMPVPIGAPGEIWVGGAGITRGYYANPAATADRFRPDCFSGREGALLYGMGDLGRWRADGMLQFLGRRDYQVKVRGCRVELQEIESVMEQHPGVNQAVVIVHADPLGDLRLAAYFTADPGGNICVAELRALLTKKLPDYMVPSWIVPLEMMPLTGSGKIDRNRLPISGRQQEKEYIPPRTETEEVLAQIWASLLGTQRVGIRDNFFHMGGHSLLAMRMISRVRDTFRVDLSLRAFFLAPTVEDLTELIAENECGESQVALIEPVDRSPGSVVALSFNQESILFQEWWRRMRSLKTYQFHISDSVRLKGRLDVEALEKAHREIIRRHEVLRTGYLGTDKKPSLSDLSAILSHFSEPGKRQDNPAAHSFFSQQVHEAVDFHLDFHDLSGLDARQREDEIPRLYTEEIEKPFDCRQPPLLRVVLLRESATEHLLFIIMHHLIGDGWSFHIFENELAELYKFFTGETKVMPPPPALQYGDFAAWQQKELRGEKLERLGAFWKKEWESSPAVEIEDLPFVKATNGEPSSSSMESMVISAEEYSQLEKAAQQHAVTFNMLSLAAVYILLHLYTGKKRLGVWGNFANRPHSKFEGTIGWFATSHLLSVEFAGDSRIADVLSRVRTAVLEASAHQMLPNGVLFARVLQNSGKRDRLRNARGPEHIVVEVVHEEWLAQPAELKLEPGLVPNSRIAEFPLYLLGLVRRNELVITARYSATRFDPAAVRSLLRDLHVVLKKMVSEPQAPVSAIVLRTLFETAHVS